MKIRWFLGTKRRKIHQVQARLHLSVKSVFSTPVQYQCRTSQVILQVIRLWDVSASVILDVTFEAVFTDAKLQECPEISVLHFKPPHICACTCILAIPKGQNSTRSWNQQVWWCVIAQLWAFTAGGAWTTAAGAHDGLANICRSYHPFLFERYSCDGSLSPPFICNSILKVFKGRLTTQRAGEWHFCRAHFRLAVNNNDRKGVHLLSCHTDNNKYSECVRYAFESS